MPEGHLPAVRLLQPGDDTAGFCSEERDLDEYLQRFALPMQLAGGPRTWVAVDATEIIIGYYSLTSSRIERANEPDMRLMRGMGGYPIPTTLLARLAVAHDRHGEGVGTDLVIHAFITAARAAEIVGSRAIEVYAVRDGLQRFYERFGFTDVYPGRQPRDLRMYVLMKDVRRTLRGQGFSA